MHSVLNKWKENRGFRFAGMKFIVLSNIHDPNGSRVDLWRHLLHVLDIAVLNFCRIVSGPLCFIGLSRGGMRVLSLSIEHPYLCLPEVGDVGPYTEPGWILSLCGYHNVGKSPNGNKQENFAFANELIQSEIKTLIMYSVHDVTSRQDQCPGYYSTLAEYSKDYSGGTPKIWIGTEPRMNHGWFGFLIDGLPVTGKGVGQMEEELRRYVFKVLSGRNWAF